LVLRWATGSGKLPWPEENLICGMSQGP
jgi:hypothetical protein